MLPSLQAHLQLGAGGRHLQLGAGGRRFLSAVKCTPNDKVYFLSNGRRLAAPRTWLHVLKPKRLPPPPPTPLIFTFKSLLQFVPNMSTRHPRTWSPTSPVHWHMKSIEWEDCVCYRSFAATRCLLVVHLHCWRVDAVMQGAYHGWGLSHTYLCNT